MHAILFFDEADACSRRAWRRWRAANDRFVNMETNFLLQQLERYEGIVILATNLETSIDQAFKRRIHYHVTIPFPDPPGARAHLARHHSGARARRRRSTTRSWARPSSCRAGTSRTR